MCILRGSFQLPSSLMWPVLESWSLRSSQTTEHLSSELKVKVCPISLVIFVSKKKKASNCLQYVIGICVTNTHVRWPMYLYINPVERNDWVTVLQDCTRGRHPRSTISPSSPLTPEYQGYLELRGLRSKLYTVVASDKVYLYKNIEVRTLCECVTLEMKCNKHIS